MMEKLATIKKISKEWGKKDKYLEQKELKEIEKRIQELYNSNTSGTFSNEELQLLKNEEGKCSILLAQEEQH